MQRPLHVSTVESNSSSTANVSAQTWTYERFVEQVVACMDHCVQHTATGSLKTVLQEHLATGGKRVRVSLMYEVAVALDVDPRACVEVAAACELLHNATLIHDDLQDRDRTRRGAPTVWAKHGDDQAINAGDIMLMLPFTVLADAPVSPSVRVALMRMLSVRAAATACGQSSEQLMLSRMRLGWSEWRQAATGKTGQIFAIPFEALALLSGRPPSVARRVGDLATGLGIVFQAVDDVLDLYGDKGRKQIGNDLREGRVSALVAAHLELQPEDERSLVGLLAMPRETTVDAHVHRWAQRFLTAGTLLQIETHLEDTISALQQDALPNCQVLCECMVVMANRLSEPLIGLSDELPVSRKIA